MEQMSCLGPNRRPIRSPIPRWCIELYSRLRHVGCYLAYRLGLRMDDGRVIFFNFSTDLSVIVDRINPQFSLPILNRRCVRLHKTSGWLYIILYTIRV